MVAQLNLSVYGTWDAAQNWSKQYTKFLRECEFVTGKGSSCNFVHKARRIALTVHGEDLTAVASAENFEVASKEI